MTSGLEWDEWNASLSSPSNDTIGIWFSDKDPVTFVLERPLVSEPGTNFTYSGGNMIVLGEILRNASGMNLDEFSTLYLFEPLGINNSIWSQFENEVIAADGQSKITPRDMAKIGVMFLNNGLWDGKQIVPGEWVEKSATSYLGNTGIKVPGTDSGRNGYSYTWWTKQYSHSGKEINMYYAGGWGGQYIMVFPELDTVVVFTGGNYTSKIKNFGILEKYILPAVE
jgi:CubicO group peptidase (beta-lactamase class C family)